MTYRFLAFVLVVFIYDSANADQFEYGSMVREDSVEVFESISGSIFMTNVESVTSESFQRDDILEAGIAQFVFVNPDSQELSFSYSTERRVPGEEFAKGSGRDKFGQLLGSDSILVTTLYIPGDGYIEVIKSVTGSLIEDGHVVRSNVGQSKSANFSSLEQQSQAISKGLDEMSLRLLEDFKYTVTDYMGEAAQTESHQAWFAEIIGLQQNRSLLGCIAGAIGTASASVTLGDALLCGGCIAFKNFANCRNCAAALGVTVSALLATIDACIDAASGGGSSSGGSSGSGGGSSGGGGHTGGGSTGSGGGGLPGGGGGSACGTACSGGECQTTCWQF